MDALRKAEEEKRRAAEARGEAVPGQPVAADPGEPASGEWALDALDELTADYQAPAADEAATDSTDAFADTTPMRPVSEELSLEPVDEQAASGTDAPPGAAAPGGLDDTYGSTTDIMDDSLEFRGPSDASLEMLVQGDDSAQGAAVADAGAGAAADEPAGSDTSPGQRSVDELASLTLTQDHDATIPSDRAIRNSVSEYFDTSRSMDTGSVEQPRRTGPLSEAAASDRTLGTPVTAQTVFNARGGRSNSRAMPLLIVAGAGLALLLAGGGLYYGLQTSSPRPAPSPNVAVGVESNAREPLQIPAVLPRQDAPVSPMEGELAEADLVARAVAGRMAGASATDAAEAQPAPESATAAPADSTTAPAIAGPPDAPQAPAGAPADPAAGDADPASAIAAAAAAAAPNTATAAAAVAADPAPALSDKAIRISRSRGAGQVDPTAASAYAAYQAGDLDAAARLYRDVLTRDERNRAALLGLAGIALREGDRAGAFQHYQRVLRLYPADTVANAALIRLQGYNGSAETDLKNRIATSPDSAYLHFMLGNLHARRGRWDDAELAYFEAVRLDPANPEFAFNLAVSLERIGQGDAAKRYYRAALDGVGSRKVAFDPALARDRIQALETGAL